MMEHNGLPQYIFEKYLTLKESINIRLLEFSKVPREDYFYELCFCLCTPQSKARNALRVVDKLKQMNFLENDFNPLFLLQDKEHYIRFHNQKAKRMILAKKNYNRLMELLNSSLSPSQKRFEIKASFEGIGMKEASHFLRNIGYRNLAILDRHILKHLVKCGLYDELPNINSEKKYLEIEKKFQNFAYEIGVPIDELDLLFWSYETGEILK